MNDAVGKEVSLNDCKTLSRQNSLLFVAGAVSVLAGLLFPKAAALVDLLMIFSSALSAAVVVICIRASKPAELTGFAMLAITAIASLLTTAIASAKLIITGDAAGAIVTHLTALNVIANAGPAPLSALLFCVLSGALLAATVAADKKLLRSAADYIGQTDAVAQTTPEPDLIVAEEPQQNHIAKEKGFFYASHAFGRLAVWISAVTSVIVILSLGTAMLAGVTASVSGKTLVALAANSGLLVQATIFCVVCAVARLVRKSVSNWLQETRITEEQFRQRITVAAREVAAQADNHRHVQSSHRPAATIDQLLFDCEQFEDETSYDLLTNLLTQCGKSNVVLIAAAGPQYAPVTIPVNVAMRLAEAELRTLIIDFDLRRRAVQRVFETADCDMRAVKTCVENISLISGKRIVSATPQTLRQIFAKAAGLYDCILVYAPEAALPSQMFEFFTAAIFLGAEGAPVDPALEKLISQLNQTGCRILTPSSLPQMCLV
jgi:hypothetical protein